MTVLDDHRHLAGATVAVTALGAFGLSLLSVVTGRAALVPGLLTGATVAAADVWLLVRGLDRFARVPAGASSRALTGALMGRFSVIGTLLGLAMAVPRLNPLGVLSGFLVFPLALVLVGVAASRRAHPHQEQGHAR